MKSIKSFLHDFFAYNCISCGRAVSENENILCDKCTDSLMFSIPSENKNVMSCVSYKEKTAKDLILYMKDHKDPDAFRYAAELVTYRIMRAMLDNVEDYFITFAPRTPMTRITKGFDQSEEIAKQVACQLLGDENRCIRLIHRKFASKQQKLLKSADRRKNSKEHLSLKRNASVPEKIIVIDDLTTTGSTLESIKKLLIDGGCRECVLVTVAVNR